MMPLLAVLAAAAVTLGSASPGWAQTAAPGSDDPKAHATHDQQKPAQQSQQQVPGPTPQETSRAEKANPGDSLDKAPNAGPQAGSSSTPASNPADPRAGAAKDKKE